MSPTVGEVYAGRYRIVRELGQGGMGVVFEAVDTVLDRAVALKVVAPSLAGREGYVDRFAREAAVLARVRSRHIVHVHEYGEVDDSVFLVTELFPDGDLRSWLREHGALGRREALEVVAQVCEALQDAHEAGVVHRDVKPANVLLWDKGGVLIPYLCDFGIAVDGSAGESLTRTGTLVGSPAYMAPERHFGKPADERGDLYSVGCLLWAALTGRTPFSGTDYEVINAHVNADVPQVEVAGPLDERINDVLARLLSKDPEARPGSAQELRHELRALLRDLESGAIPVPAAPVVAAGAAPGPDSADDAGGADSADSGPPEGAASTVLRDDSRPSRPPAPAAPPSPGPEVGAEGTALRERSDEWRLGTGAAPPPAGPPPTGGSEGDPPADEPAQAPVARRSRRGVVLAAVAVVLVVLLGSAVAIGLTRGDDPAPVADDPATSPAPAPTSASPTETEPPARPRVTAAAAYRSVRFEVAAEEGVALELRRGSRWVEVTGGSVTLPTDRGGQRACLQVRAVVGEVASPVARECGTSRAPQVSLVREDGPCSRDIDGTTYPCVEYGVRVEGLEPGATPLAEVLPQGETPWCSDPDLRDRFCRSVSIGDDGRGVLREYFAILTDSGTARVRVAGVTSKPVRLFCGAPCQ